MSDGALHADEFRTDADLVRRLVAGQFPEWADLPIRPVASDGTVNALYRLGADMVVRLPRSAGLCEDADQQHELLLHLGPFLPVAIPFPLGKGAPAEGYPWPWSIYRWIDGRTLTAGHDAAPSLGRDLAGFVHALHGIDSIGGPTAGRGVHPAVRDRETRHAIEALPDLIDTAAATAAWETSIAAEPWQGPPVWIHGDLLPGNLLVKGGRLCGVIDFGAAGVGDPACDLIPAWSVLSSSARRTFRDALALDDATWVRGRGWALSIGLIIIPYYRDSHPRFAALGVRMVDEVLADHGSGGADRSGPGEAH